MTDINNQNTRELPELAGLSPERVKEEITQPQKPEKAKKTDNRRRLWVPILTCCLLICITCLTIFGIKVRDIFLENGIMGVSQMVTPILKTEDPPDYNIVIFGTDKGGYRTDTMMVAHYDKETDKAYVMQLPRDSYVEGNGRRDKKLNSAYFSGIEQLKKEIKLAYMIDVDKFLSVDSDGFIEAVDAIGGVEIDVPINMNYDDPTPGQDLHIHIKKGLQVLDGADAEGFVRFRQNNDGSGYPMGDLQRIQVQRQFLNALVKKVISADGLAKIPELLKVAKDNLKTDINNDDAYKYIYKILTLGTDNIEFIEAPGAPRDMGGSYFVVDRTDAARVSNQYFGGKNKVSGTYNPKKSYSDITVYEEDETEYQYNEQTYFEPTPKPTETKEPEEDTAEEKPDSTAKATATPKSDANLDATPKASINPTAKPTADPIDEDITPTKEPEENNSDTKEDKAHVV